MKRAYSLLTVKSIDEDLRIIEGIATTPTTDRVGDVVEPEGAQFKLPITLLWQHQRDMPVGSVTAAKVTPEGISIKAQFAQVAEPPSLKEELDVAWAKVKAGLVGGLSIGFKDIETADIKGTWGIRYLKWLWLELSCVTIPANADCSIQTIKSLDEELLRTRAPKHPGAVYL